MTANSQATAANRATADGAVDLDETLHAKFNPSKYAFLSNTDDRDKINTAERAALLSKYIKEGHLVRRLVRRTQDTLLPSTDKEGELTEREAEDMGIQVGDNSVEHHYHTGNNTPAVPPAIIQPVPKWSTLLAVIGTAALTALGTYIIVDAKRPDKPYDVRIDAATPGVEVDNESNWYEPR